jgi:transcriptional regulator with XRE-family HTH domain
MTQRAEQATPLTRHIGVQVRDLRKSQGMTQQQLADMVRRRVPGFDRTSLFRTEAGRRYRLTVDELFAFASVLNVPLDRLLPEQPAPRSIRERVAATARQLDDIARELSE